MFREASRFNAPEDQDDDKFVVGAARGEMAGHSHDMPRPETEAGAQRPPSQSDADGHLERLETSRYQLFVKAMTAKLKSDDPSCNQTDRMKQIGRLWRGMTVDERDRIIAAQRAADGGAKSFNKARSGPKVEVNGLKRGQQDRRIAAFNFFVRDMVAKVRQEQPDIEHKRCMKIVGEAWHRLSKAERAKWCFDPPSCPASSGRNSCAGGTQVGVPLSQPVPEGKFSVAGGHRAHLGGEGQFVLGMPQGGLAVPRERKGMMSAELDGVSPGLLEPPLPAVALSGKMGAEKKTALKDESRYDIFVKAQSVKLQESEPHLSQTQRMARIGQLWKSMTKEERLQVILDHKALMAANGIRDKATVNYGPMLKVGGLKRRQHERRISAFNFFVKDTVAKLRAGNPSLEHEACMKRVGEMWRALSQEERAKWCLDPPVRGERGAKCGEPKDMRGSRSSGSVASESPLEQSLSPPLLPRHGKAQEYQQGDRVHLWSESPQPPPFTAEEEGHMARAEQAASQIQWSPSLSRFPSFSYPPSSANLPASHSRLAVAAMAPPATAVPPPPPLPMRGSLGGQDFPSFSEIVGGEGPAGGLGAGSMRDVGMRDGWRGPPLQGAGSDRASSGQMFGLRGEQGLRGQMWSDQTLLHSLLSLTPRFVPPANLHAIWGQGPSASQPQHSQGGTSVAASSPPTSPARRQVNETRGSIPAFDQRQESAIWGADVVAGGAAQDESLMTGSTIKRRLDKYESNDAVSKRSRLDNYARSGDEGPIVESPEGQWGSG